MIYKIAFFLALCTVVHAQTIDEVNLRNVQVDDTEYLTGDDIVVTWDYDTALTRGHEFTISFGSQDNATGRLDTIVQHENIDMTTRSLTITVPETVFSSKYHVFAFLTVFRDGDEPGYGEELISPEFTVIQPGQEIGEPGFTPEGERPPEGGFTFDAGSRLTPFNWF